MFRRLYKCWAHRGAIHLECVEVAETEKGFWCPAPPAVYPKLYPEWSFTHSDIKASLNASSVPDTILGSDNNMILVQWKQ